MSQKKASKSSSDAPATVQHRLIGWVLNLPRVARILMVALFALSVTLILTVLVTYQLEITLHLPREVVVGLVFISTGMGAVMYIFGWRFIVGTVGEHPPIRAAALWYVLVGVMVFLVALFVLLIGFISGSEL